MDEASRGPYRLKFVVLAAGLSPYSLLQSMLSPLLTTLQRDLHTSQNAVTWVVTAFLLTASVSTPILGRLGDRYGKEKLLLVSLTALVVGCVLAALASSITVMIIARSVQGLGGGILPLSFGILRDEFPAEKVGSVVGFLSSLLAVAGGIGVVVAGPLVNAFDYHWIFGLAAIVVGLATVATYLFIPDSPIRTPGKIALVPAVLLSASLIFLLLGFSQIGVWGWGSPRVAALIMAGLLLGVAWVRAELASTHPLIDMAMMRLRTVWTTNAVAFLIGAMMYSLFTIVPEFLQTPMTAGYGFGSSLTLAGLLLLPPSLVMFVGGSISGLLIARFSARSTLTLACCVISLASRCVAWRHASLFELIAGVSLMNGGLGLLYAGISARIVEAVPVHQTGAASGMNANIRTMGGAIGAAVISSVVTANLQPDGLPSESGYTVALVLLGGMMLIASAFTLLIPELVRVAAPRAVESGRTAGVPTSAVGAARSDRGAACDDA